MSDGTEKNTELTYEELCALYGDPHKHNFVSKNRNKTEFLYGIIALSATALLYILTMFFYSRPVITMGGTAIHGKTVNIFTFISSVYNKMKETVSGLANAEAEDILGVFGIIQNAVAFAFSAFVFVIQSVILIKSVVCFFQQKNRLLPGLLLSAVKWNVCDYVIFNFLCNVSGGEDSTYYYIGDIPSVAMDAGMFLAAGAFVSCVVLQSINLRSSIKDNGLHSKVLQLYLNFAAGFSIWIIYALMPAFRICEYVITGSISSVFSAILTNSFSFISLIFSVSNLFILIISITVFEKINLNFKYSVNNLFDERELKFSAGAPAKPSKKRKTKKRKSNPIFLFIFSALCTAIIAILHIPEIGMGWSVNLLPYYIAMSAVTFVWWITTVIQSRVIKAPAV